MIETVVVLPVVLLLFLGLWFMKEMVDTRMRATEAVRYLTWEMVWNARENRGGRAPKDDGTLKNELVAMGMGRNLVSITGVRARQSMKDYAGSVNGRNGFAGLPQFATTLLNPERTASGSSVKPGTSQVPGFDSVSGVVQQLLNAADYTFVLSDLIAKTTLWKDEADGAVFSSEVTYSVTGRSVFRFLGDTRIRMRSSILSHPYNVVRGTDQSEYDRIFGTGDVGDCFSESGKGHIFDLWFVPSVPVPGLQEGVSAGKCIFSTLGSVLSITKFLGGDLEFKIPDGTTKEYPEKNE